MVKPLAACIVLALGILSGMPSEAGFRDSILRAVAIKILGSMATNLASDAIYNKLRATICPSDSSYRTQFPQILPYLDCEDYQGSEAVSKLRPTMPVRPLSETNQKPSPQVASQVLPPPTTPAVPADPWAITPQVRELFSEVEDATQHHQCDLALSKVRSLSRVWGRGHALQDVKAGTPEQIRIGNQLAGLIMRNMDLRASNSCRD